MLNAIARNQKKGNLEGRLFEVANIFIPGELPLKEYPDERDTLCIGVFGEKESFFTLKGMAEKVAETLFVEFSYEPVQKPFLHPGISAAILSDNKKIGWIGQLHPTICEELALEKAPCLLELNYDALPAKAELRVKPLPAFPDVVRDIAFTVAESVTCAEAEECILHAVKAVKKAELFDVYRGLQVGQDKKSMAFRLTFAAEDKPLSPETVDGYFKKILGALNHKLGAELR